LNLIARARQFSSFILVVGKIISAEKFDPKCAIIIKDKDELDIPLDMNTIPTPKEFRDAIESLSPEQQRFAKAIRSMQLASTLFGIVIIQIKPQLEKLLKIPHDSLSKEIKMTQDLMDLFITYQIPSDLISYGGDPSGTKTEKLNKVKGHIQAMQTMIDNERKKEIQEVKQEALFGAYDSIASAHSVPVHSPRSMTTSYAMMPTTTTTSTLSSRSMSVMPTPEVISNKGSLASGSVPTPEVGNNRSDRKLSISSGGVDDYTQIPVEMDRKFEALDVDGALRPTIVDIAKVWTKKSQKALLAPQTEQTLYIDEQAQERNRAFDLLDALSRSGCLSFDHASLHVVLASTHCFDKTLMNTVIQNNVNPVEKVERSVLIVATTIHDQPASELVAPEQLKRVATYSPLLFGEEVSRITM